eukprot:scaffold1049_cov168-Amphora_coffeaeformis.AAC.14
MHTDDSMLKRVAGDIAGIPRDARLSPPSYSQPHFIFENNEEEEEEDSTIASYASALNKRRCSEMFDNMTKEDLEAIAERATKKAKMM